MDTSRTDPSTLKEIHDDADAFVQLLVEHGACTAAEARSVLVGSQNPWSHLGRILIKHGALTFTDVSYILEVQDREPGSRFGDLAVELGFCTREQVDKAVEQQSRSGAHFLDVITEHRSADPDRLVAALVAWSKRLGSALERELREKRENRAA